MIFKKRSKLFWVEAILYAAIIIVCMLGSFGVFDAKAQEPLSVDTCEKWVNLPPNIRVSILRIGMITELRKSELGGATGPLIDCLSDYMPDLDKAIVDECGTDTREVFLDEVFDKHLERIVFRCLKWVRVEKTNETIRD
jgi:hypothetical protein